jgi:autotransporter-associated beta strand protein
MSQPLRFLLVAIALSYGSLAQAGTTNFTWTGAAAANNTNFAGQNGNWVVDQPVANTPAPRFPSSSAGDDFVIFQGTVGPTHLLTDLSVSARNVRGIRFDSATGANAFTLNVSSLQSSSSSFGFNLRPDGILNNDDDVQVFNTPIKLFTYAGGPPTALNFTFNNTLTGGGLTFSGVWSSGIAGKETVNMNAGNLIIDGVAGTTTTIGTTGGGIISGTGSILTKNGAGTLVLGGTAANTYTGGTIVNSGTVTANKSSAFGTGYLAVNGGIVNLAANSQTVTTFTNAGTINGTATLTASSHWLQAGTVNVSLGGASAALTKLGGGTATLTGANSYGGNTTVSAGTLALSGSGSIVSSVIAIAAGATFDVSGVTGYSLGAGQSIQGQGTVTGNVTANGTVSPGSSIGTLTFNGNLTLAGTAQMEIDRGAGQTADLVIGTSVAEGGTLNVVNIGAPLVAGDLFNLIDGTLSGAFTTMNLPTLDGGLDWDTSDLATGGTIQVVAIPEPSAVTLSILGGCGLLFAMRKKA